MSLERITNEENRKSIEAALQRGLGRGLYDASRVAAAKAAYSAKKDEWLKSAGKSVVRTQPSSEDTTKRYDSVVNTLNMLLGDSNDALTPDNFTKYRPTIEEQLFPVAESLGVPDIRQIKANYQLELVQSNGGPNNPSLGRLGYIKGHLRVLQERMQQHKP